MAAATSGLQMASTNPCFYSSRRIVKAGAAVFGINSKVISGTQLTYSCHISSLQPFYRSFRSSSAKFDKFVMKAMSQSSENKPVSGLSIDLKGRCCFALFYTPISKNLI